MGEIRWEFGPVRVILDVKAIPLSSSKISRLWSHDRLLPFDTPIHGSTEDANFHVHMNSLTFRQTYISSSLSTIHIYNQSKTLLVHPV
ncbi:hypothetical protein TNCV_1156791 [Trichonephila clavipes]|nr:hypothetical protein TNCV_1156791 [Trichonephila clavipes]